MNAKTTEGDTESSQNYSALIFASTSETTRTETEGSKDDDFGTEIRCGVDCFHPQWLQIFASKKSFALVYLIIITVQATNYTYKQGIVSTIEKQYGFSSQTAGSLNTAVHIGDFVTNLSLVYLVGKGHKARWFALGTFLLGVANLLQALPHFLFNQEYDVGNYHSYTRQNISRSSKSIHRGSERSHECVTRNGNQQASNYAYYFFFASGIIQGVGKSTARSSGLVYLDDNIRKNIFPMMLTSITAIKSIGNSAGYLLSSFTLSLYVDLSSPKYTDKNQPTWVGAWWIGFIPFAGILFLVSAVLILFPRALPRAAMRKNDSQTRTQQETISVRDFADSIKRVLRRRIVLLDLWASACFSIGIQAHNFFYSKYVETVFGLTASHSNLLIGFVSLFGQPISQVLLGFIMTKFRPNPRSLISSSIVLHMLVILSFVSFIFLTCPHGTIRGHRNEDNSWNFTEECNANQHCKEDTKFSPVCYPEKELVYYSPCHAGCGFNSTTNQIEVHGKLFNHCSCAPKMGSLVSGQCKQDDCFPKLMVFLIIATIVRLAATLVYTIKKIMRLRYVDDADKSLYMGLQKGIVTAVTFPVPILYGALIDYACVSFNKSYRKFEHCLWYDIDKIRYVFNGVAAGFISLSLLSEPFLRYHIKGLKMYDEDFNELSHEEAASSILNDKLSIETRK